jgi:sugar lactone lactonase YvrE
VAQNSSEELVVASHCHSKPITGEAQPAASDIRSLPDPATWVNLASLGARGDGEFDNTEILQAAIDKYPAIYLPTGRYRVTRTIHLKPDTALIGLHPFTTQILIKDGTPAFAGVHMESGSGRRGGGAPAFPGSPVPLVESSRGGREIVTGIGLDTGGNNPAATALKWMAGKDSMVNDVKFLGGHGSVSWDKIYNPNHTADPDPTRRWDSQFPSLLVTNGGGGTFLNLWTASTFAAAGMEVSNTSTEGRVYELSSEHHVRNEIVLRNASNWSFFSPQTEEERGEGPFALPMEIDSCSNILVANFTIYRVISMEQPFPYAVRVANSKDVHFRGVHSNSNSKAAFDNFLFNASTGVEVRDREIASLTVTGAEKPKTFSGPKPEKLASGFFNISGGAVDGKGDFYFVDSHFHRIYQWDASKGGVSVIQDSPLQPVNIAFDKAGALMVVSYLGKGTVYSFKPGDSDVTQLHAQPLAANPDSVFALPVSDFELNRDLMAGRPVQWSNMFVSPDGTTILPVNPDFLNGEMSWGVKAQAVIRSYGLAHAKAGQTFYMTGENNARTYSMTVGQDGSLRNGRLFAERGGEGVAVDAKGNVYLAAGEIYVYSPNGEQTGMIHVPERPIQIMFGGKDGHTLFITTRNALYSVRL